VRRRPAAVDPAGPPDELLRFFWFEWVTEQEIASESDWEVLSVLGTRRYLDATAAWCESESQSRGLKPGVCYETCAAERRRRFPVVAGGSWNGGVVDPDRVGAGLRLSRARVVVA